MEPSEFEEFEREQERRDRKWEHTLAVVNDIISDMASDVGGYYDGSQIEIPLDDASWVTDYREHMLDVIAYPCDNYDDIIACLNDNGVCDQCRNDIITDRDAYELCDCPPIIFVPGGNHQQIYKEVMQDATNYQ